MSKKNIAQQKVLIYDPERCTGCRYCEIACSATHFGFINFDKSHVHAFWDEKTEDFEVSICHHCEDPVCAASCPVDAIVKEEGTGWVKINPLKCIGCKTCNYACPLSIPWFDGEHRISLKCDFCDPVRNGNPACAEYCSSKALRVVIREEAWKFNEKTYLQMGKKNV